jgi:hypothetical protein
MGLFAVLLPNDNPKLATAIKEKYPENYQQLSSTQWIISAKGTARQISNTLGVTSEEDERTIGPAIILSITSYWGRASVDVWEWMRVKGEEGSNG